VGGAIGGGDEERASIGTLYARANAQVATR
jgi:hypothetical protein